MTGEQYVMLVRSHPDELYPHQRASGQVERHARLGLEQFRQPVCAPRFIKIREVFGRNLKLEFRGKFLEVAVGPECGPERLVTLNQPVKGSQKGVVVELTAQLERE
jgi:hypothetical protein